ncbi:hypothetical protein GIB67_018315 [Kingdonia uniflora]|uniref:Uncharacterized protein n=1 Tax=Kingdonia uniflora TaxID=39325 RepID=A0A7J7MJI1_9MAGN|nr:hypothetical protein GIB67_018315 [Kingdonia uniflora]
MEKEEGKEHLQNKDKSCKCHKMLSFRMIWMMLDYIGWMQTLHENDARKIYQGMNGGNDFKHRKGYKILAREPRWANLRDDGLNHAGNVPRNVSRRTPDNSSLGNSV